MFLLQDHFLANTQRNQNMVGELLTILALFEMHEIPVAPYKGPVMANSLYGNPAIRDCGDLDLLIRKSDVARARDLLSEQGYHLSQTDATDVQQALILRYKHSYNLFSDKTQINVDLHWRFTDHAIHFDLDLESLWAYLEPSSFAGRTVLSPSPEILLILLCVHGSKHFNPWNRLIWVCDIARLIKICPKMDWQRVLKYAEQLGSVRMLFVGILLADNLLGSGVPEEISSRVASDPIASILAIQVSKWMFSENERATQYDEKAIPNLIFHLRMRERLRDRIKTFSRLTHRKLSFNASYRASLTTLPWQGFLPLLFSTFHPRHKGFGRHS